MIDHELRQEDAILIIHPEHPIASEELQALASDVDPFIEQRGGLKGLMIQVDKFPGWADLSGMVAHLRFVHDHHRKIARVALVTDDKVLSHLPELAKHFVAAEVEHFATKQANDALVWLRGA